MIGAGTPDRSQQQPAMTTTMVQPSNKDVSTPSQPISGRLHAAVVSPEPESTSSKTMDANKPLILTPPPGVPEIQLAMWRAVLQQRTRQIQRLPYRYLQSFANDIMSDLLSSRYHERNEYSKDLEGVSKMDGDTENLFEEVDHAAGKYSSFLLTKQSAPTDISADQVVLHLLALSYRSMDDRLPSAMRKHGINTLRRALEKLKLTLSKWETHKKRKEKWQAKMVEQNRTEQLRVEKDTLDLQHVARKKKKMAAKAEYDGLLAKYKARRGFIGIELVTKNGMWSNNVQVIKKGESWGEKEVRFSLGDLLVSEAAMAADFATRLDLSLRRMIDNEEKLSYLRGLMVMDPPEYVECSDKSIPWVAYNAAKAGSRNGSEPFNFHNPSAVKKERNVEIKARKLSHANQAFTSARKLEIFHGLVRAIISVLSTPKAM